MTAARQAAPKKSGVKPLHSKVNPGIRGRAMRPCVRGEAKGGGRRFVGADYDLDAEVQPRMDTNAMSSCDSFAIAQFVFISVH